MPKPSGRSPSANAFEMNVLKVMRQVHPLERVPRSGYLLRGVTEPESVAAHTYEVALLTLLMCGQYPERFDKSKALAMALLHDLAEAKLMDIPMPAVDGQLKSAKRQAEQMLFEQMMEGLEAPYAALHQELAEAASPEARLVRGLDKAQMMLKVQAYQEEGRGALEEFWDNPRNFDDQGLQEVSRLFDAICLRAIGRVPSTGRAAARYDASVRRTAWYRLKC